jgi:hypothetical protein
LRVIAAYCGAFTATLARRRAAERGQQRATAALLIPVLSRCHFARPPIRIKDLRRFSALAWAMAGVPIERIADYLGHSTIRLTIIYARFRPHDEFDAPLIERADAIASGKLTSPGAGQPKQPR